MTRVGAFGMAGVLNRVRPRHLRRRWRVDAGKAKLTGSNTSRTDLALRCPDVVFKGMGQSAPLGGDEEGRQHQVMDQPGIIAGGTHT